MNRNICKTFFFAVAAGLLSVVSHAEAQGMSTGEDSTEVLIQVGKGTGASTRAAGLAVRTPGARVMRSFSEFGWARVKLPAGKKATPEVLAELSKSTGATVIPNYRRYAHATPNDLRYPEQWALPQIAAERAWNAVTGSADNVVAVIDSGINFKHPDLAGNMWKNPGESGQGRESDGIDNDKNGYVDDVYGISAIDGDSSVMDAYGHGTHIAGIIGAVGNNNIGVSGVNWRTKIMALKFMNGIGNGTDADAMECISYAIKMKQAGVKIRAVNCSFGGMNDSPAFKASFDALAAAGILAVCSAGNGDTDPSNGSNVGDDTDSTPNYPAAFTSNSIISVGASDQFDTKTSFSNYGATSVDLFAPGLSILSTGPNTGYRMQDGTSQAAAFVSGAVALISGKSGYAGMGGIKKRILNSVDKFPQLEGKCVSGGRLNLNRAVRESIYSISGEVYRVGSDDVKVHLAGAKIFLNGTQLSNTDESGTYAIPYLPPASYKIEVRMPGFSFPVKWVSLPNTDNSPASPNAIRNFQATETASAYYTVTGTAFDENDLPKAGVSIYWNALPEPIAITDADGNYVIKERIASVNTLKAQGFNLAWRADPSSLTLPTTDQINSPDGVVNFYGTVPDTQAPKVVITTPSDGATLDTPSTSATGTATDPAGVDKVFFVLYRNGTGGTEYYDWVQKFWVTDSELPGVVFTKQAAGETTYNWKITLPVLSDNSYTLLAWARDVKGNESNGGPNEDSSSFTVDAVTQ